MGGPLGEGRVLVGRPGEICGGDRLADRNARSRLYVVTTASFGHNSFCVCDMIERCVRQTDNCGLFLANGGLARAATNEEEPPTEAKSLPAMTGSAAGVSRLVFVIDSTTPLRVVPP